MQENEIKIGNWFEHLPEWSHRNAELKSFLFQWEASDWYSLGECTLSLDYINPIDLSPEILEKCGFKEMPSKGFNKVVRVRLKTIELSVFLNGNIYLERQGEDILLPLKYTHLHQLQNLYFALTGEELNYTP